MGNIGPWEVAIVLLIALLVFGPKKLPEMGRSLGKGIREFKSGITGDHESDHVSATAQSVTPAPPQLPPAAPPPAAAVPTATPADSTGTHR